MQVPSRLQSNSSSWWQARNWEATYSQGFLGVALDDESMPSDVRKYARYCSYEFKDTVGRDKYRFELAAPSTMYQDYHGHSCFPYKNYMQLDRKALTGSQRQGDCTSWSVRGAVDVARSFEIGTLKQLEELRAIGATAGYYAERGHTGEGASTSRIANAALRIGILLEEKLTSPEGKAWDFTDYSKYYRMGDRYGRTGLPDWITDITSKNQPRQIATITTKEELLTALWNGAGVCLGSSVGVSSTGGTRGVGFLSSRKGRWAHAMLVCGFDDTRNHLDETIIVWDNSWGNWNKVADWPEAYKPIPQGAFSLTLEDTLWAIRHGECFAISDVHGFRPRRLKTLGATGNV
jgi:hypothetical protein